MRLHLFSLMLALLFNPFHTDFYPGNTPVDLNDPLVYHRLIEAQKFAYAQRTKLGDADMVKGALEIAKNMTQPEFVAWISSLIQDKGQALNYYCSFIYFCEEKKCKNATGKKSAKYNK